MFRHGLRIGSDTVVVIFILICIVLDAPVAGSSQADALITKRRELESRIRQVRSMFRHAYDSYMNYAYPADELMPISCAGRIRGVTQSRGDIDDALGNFSLTLIDSLDTIFLMNDLDEFESAVRKVVSEVRFDTDVVVSVFEANIRVLGGLLSAHVAANTLKQRSADASYREHGKTVKGHRSKNTRRFSWYSDELLHQAVDLADRLLVAFNTSESGLPFSRVNLRKGNINSDDAQGTTTCTACAGTFLLEFGALSRLTNDARYERAARRALDFIWLQRNRATDLVGTVLNIHNGEWIRKESSVGAGIDSYYEYLLKAYVLFDDREMLRRFETHYTAVMRFLYRNAFVHDAYMNRPDSSNRHFVDALFAFWPSVQVLVGDVHRAVELHETLAHVHRKHGFLPEAFTAAESDFTAFWEHHLLRPELAESTYFLFAATKDPYYTQIGAQIADNLELHARTSCGYAALSSVHTKQRSDQMDSYVLAETFKYLHLLFVDSLAAFDATHPSVRSLQRLAVANERRARASFSCSAQTTANCSNWVEHLDDADSDGDGVLEPSELLPVDVNQYVFTTEAHILPLTLARVPDDYDFSQSTAYPSAANFCANTLSNQDAALNASGMLTAASIRLGVRELVRGRTSSSDSTCGAVNNAGKRSTSQKRLVLKDIVWNNPEHLRSLAQLGLEVSTTIDGRMQISFTAEKARSTDDAAEGVRLLHEVMEATKANGGHLPITQQEEPVPIDYRYVQITSYPFYGTLAIKGGPAQFGPHPRALNDPKTSTVGVRGRVVKAAPFEACAALEPDLDLTDSIALVRRGGCMFVEKTLAVQRAGAIGVIVLDDAASSDVESTNGFSMSGDSKLDSLVTIPAAFLFRKQADFLLDLLDVYNNSLAYPIVAAIVAEPAAFELPQHVLFAAPSSPTLNDTEAKVNVSVNHTESKPANTFAKPKNNADPMSMATVHMVPSGVWQLHGPQKVPITSNTLQYTDLLFAARKDNLDERAVFLKLTDVVMRTSRELLRGRSLVFYAALAQTLSRFSLEQLIILNDPARYELLVLTVIKQTLSALLRGASYLSVDETAAKHFAAIDEEKRGADETEKEILETMWLWTKNLTDGSNRIIRMRTTEAEKPPEDDMPSYSQVFVDSRDLNDIQPVLDVLVDRIINAFRIALTRKAATETNERPELEKLIGLDDDSEDEAELEKAGVSSSMVNSFVNSLFSHLVRDALGDNVAKMILGSEELKPVPSPAAEDDKQQLNSGDSPQQTSDNSKQDKVHFTVSAQAENEDDDEDLE